MNRRYRPSTSSGRTEAVVGKWNILYLPFALFSLAVWAAPSQAVDRVVVIPMGNHGAPVTKTGQATKSVAGDDGG